MLLDRRFSNRTAALLAVLVFAVAPVGVSADDTVSLTEAESAYNAAVVQYQSKQFRDAAVSFHRFAAKFVSDPRSLEAVFLEAESLHADKQYAPAAIAFDEFLQRAAQRNEFSTAENDAKSKEATYVVRAMFRRGESAYFAGQDDSAREALTRFRDQFPDNRLTLFADRLLSSIAVRELERFVAPLRSAQDDVRSDDVPSANRRVKEALSSNPPEPIRTRALYLDGQIAALRGDWENTRKSMAQCLTGDALKSFSPAEVAEAHFWYAESLFRLSGEHAQNKPAQVQQAFAAAAKHTESKWAAMVTLRLAQLAADRGEWSAALARADSIAATYPDFEMQFEVDHLIGRALVTRGELDNARKAFRRSIANPKSEGSETAAVAQWRIGETLMHQSRYKEALTEFLRVDALHQWPEWTAASVLEAGSCYKELGRRHSAIEAYTRVMTDHANSHSAKEAADRLAKMSSPSRDESATARLSVGSPR